MTHQELKEKAAHFAKKFAREGEILTAGESVDAIVIYFEGDCGTRVKVVLDRNTGAPLAATGIPATG